MTTKLSTLHLALAQISPVWLNKEATTEKIIDTINNAGKEQAELIVFGEGVLPGYPHWLAYTNGAGWNLDINKTLHAHYCNNAVCIEDGDLDEICNMLKSHSMSCYLGIIERPKDRGGHSLYASLVFINSAGEIKSVHRKLQPTYDERLTWSPGDGHGLQVHKLKQFTVGGLNCWENWMPLPRASLYAQGENLHIAVWPGSEHNTKDITRFIARESRSFVVSVSSVMTTKDFPEDTPFLNDILKNAPTQLSNGGSAIAGPDGEFLLEPVINKEGIIYKTIDFKNVYKERQNFDPVGHYSRPDVTQLHVNRERQSTVVFKDSK